MVWAFAKEQQKNRADNSARRRFGKMAPGKPILPARDAGTTALQAGTPVECRKVGPAGDGAEDPTGELSRWSLDVSVPGGGAWRRMRAQPRPQPTYRKRPALEQDRQPEHRSS